MDLFSLVVQLAEEAQQGPTIWCLPAALVDLRQALNHFISRLLPLACSALTDYSSIRKLPSCRCLAMVTLLDFTVLPRYFLEVFAEIWVLTILVLLLFGPLFR